MFGTLVHNFKHPIFLNKTQTMKMHKKTNINKFPKKATLSKTVQKKNKLSWAFTM